MRLLIIACATVPISAAAAEAASQPQQQPQRLQFVQATPDEQCPKPLMHSLDPNAGTHMKKLDELPPADAFHAVYRLDDKGCIDPVMVGYQYGRRR